MQRAPDDRLVALAVRNRAAAVGASLVAFIIVYVAVFGAGRYYILRLMSRSPANNEPRLKDVTNSPTRTAGTTPAQQHPTRNVQPGE